MSRYIAHGVLKLWRASWWRLS